MMLSGRDEDQYPLFNPASSNWQLIQGQENLASTPNIHFFAFQYTYEQRGEDQKKN